MPLHPLTSVDCLKKLNTLNYGIERHMTYYDVTKVRPSVSVHRFQTKPVKG